MRARLICGVTALVLVFAVSGGRLAIADDVLTKATTAVTDIIFNYEADEFSSYNVQEDGFVDINFASNTPDKLYSEILAKLQSHPDIKGVLAGKNGPACPLF